MADILLDNLGLSAACSVLHRSATEPSTTLKGNPLLCWQQFLTSIILWDNYFHLPKRVPQTLNYNAVCGNILNENK
jgi:hypothetical protein